MTKAVVTNLKYAKKYFCPSPAMMRWLKAHAHRAHRRTIKQLLKIEDRWDDVPKPKLTDWDID
jgi:hypothetical protein